MLRYSLSRLTGTNVIAGRIPVAVFTSAWFHRRTGMFCSTTSLLNKSMGAPISSQQARQAIRESQGVNMAGGEMKDSETVQLGAQLNQLKRQFKGTKNRKQHREISDQAKKLLYQGSVDPTEPSESAVSLILNSASFFGADAEAQIVNDCVTWMRENLAGCEAQNVALFSHAIGVLKVPDVMAIIFNEVVPRLQQLVDKMLPVEFAMVLQTFARLGKMDEQLVQAMVVRIQNSFNMIKMGELSTMCTALAKLRYRDPKFWNGTFESVIHNAATINSSTMVQFFKAIGELEKTNLDVTSVLEALGKRSEQLSFQSSEIPEVFQNLAVLQYAPSTLIEKLGDRLGVVSGYLSSDEIQIVASSCRKLKLSPPRAFDDVFNSTQRSEKLIKYSPFDKVAKMVRELALLNYGNPAVYVAVVELVNASATDERYSFLPSVLSVLLACQKMLPSASSLALLALSGRTLQLCGSAPLEQLLLSVHVLLGWSAEMKGIPPGERRHQNASLEVESEMQNLTKQLLESLNVKSSELVNVRPAVLNAVRGRLATVPPEGVFLNSTPLFSTEDISQLKNILRKA